MATFHLTVKAHSRSDNANSVALASYRSGEKLLCETDGRTRQCRRGHKSDVLLSALINSRDLTRQQLWNKAEKAETRKNSIVAREIEVALPYEVSQDVRNSLALSLSQAIADKYDCAVDVAVHSPDHTGDDRNFHAHILFTSRSWEDDNNEFSKKKYRDLNIGKGNAEVTFWRELWECLVNDAYEEAGINEKVSASSSEARNELKKYERLNYKKYVALRREGKQEEYIKMSRSNIELARDKLTAEELIGEIKNLEKLYQEKERDHVRNEAGRSETTDGGIEKRSQKGNSRREQESVERDSHYDYRSEGESERKISSSESDKGFSPDHGAEYEKVEPEYDLTNAAGNNRSLREREADSLRNPERDQSKVSGQHKQDLPEFKNDSGEFRRNLGSDRRPRESFEVHPGHFKNSGNEIRRRVFRNSAVARRVNELGGQLIRLCRIFKSINSFYQQSLRSVSRSRGINDDQQNVESGRIKRLILKAAKPIRSLISKIPLLNKQPLEVEFEEYPKIEPTNQQSISFIDQSHLFTASAMLHEEQEKEKRKISLQKDSIITQNELKTESKGISI